MDVVEGEDFENLVMEFKIQEKLWRFLADARRSREPMEILIHRSAQEILSAIG